MWPGWGGHDKRSGYKHDGCERLTSGSWTTSCSGSLLGWDEAGMEAGWRRTEHWEFCPSISTRSLVLLMTCGFCLFGFSGGGNFYYSVLAKTQIAFSYMDKKIIRVHFIVEKSWWKAWSNCRAVRNRLLCQGQGGPAHVHGFCSYSQRKISGYVPLEEAFDSQNQVNRSLASFCL